MGLRCLLIAVNQTRTPYPVYPLALACLAGALHEAGHQVEQFDCMGQIDDTGATLAETIAVFSPDLVAVSIRNLDSEDCSRPESYLTDALPIMKQVRQATTAPVVLGGAAFSLMPERIMEILKPDWGIAGEGEELLVKLADQLAAGQVSQPKLMHAKLNDTIWKPLCFDRSISSYYLNWGGILNVQTKRGCPYGCAYCSYPVLEGRKIRKRDPLSVVDDVRRLEQNFQARYIFFTDSVFNDPDSHFLEVCEALIKNNNKVPWTAYFRPTGICKEHLDIMKRAGLDAMEVGADCGCDTTLAEMNKGFTFKDVLHFHALAAAAKIPCAYFIMFGGPGETRETVRQSLENLDKLDPAVIMAFNGVRILPRTRIYDAAIRDGIIHRDQDLLAPVYYHSKDIDKATINTMIDEKWNNRPDRICPGVSMTERVAQFHQKGFTGPIWDKIIRMGWN